MFERVRRVPASTTLYQPPPPQQQPPPQQSPPGYPQSGPPPGYPPPAYGYGPPPATDNLAPFRIFIGVVIALIALALVVMWFVYPWLEAENVEGEAVADLTDEYIDAVLDSAEDNLDEDVSRDEMERQVNRSFNVDDLDDADADDILGLEGEEDTGITAWEIWIGRDMDADEDLSLFIGDVDEGQEGFEAVRDVDRMLLLVPVLATLLVVLAVAFAVGGRRRNAIGAVLLSGLLLAAIFGWEYLSSEQFGDDFVELFEEQFNPDTLSGGEADFLDDYLDATAEFFGGFLALTYNTLFFKILAAAALVLSLLGIFLARPPAPQYGQYASPPAPGTYLGQ